MRTDELEYDFDPSLVATKPVEPRDSARLMLVDRARGSIEHRTVRDLAEILGPGDGLVVNRTSVLRARLMLVDHLRGLETEGLLLEPAALPGLWRVLVRGAKRLRPGARVELRDRHGELRGDALELVARDEEAWIVRPSAGPAGGDLGAILERSGHVPLPPYVLRSRRERHESTDDDADRRDYETVYADAAARGSVAAPTAGLHFTDGLLDTLANRGVGRHEVLLHVGAGTFKPVETDDLDRHPMHAEHYSVPPETLRALAERRTRLVAIGTTTVRALESLPDPLPDPARHHEAVTRLLIAPGHRFRFVDALLTNFHLPRSTLLALVGAFAGMELLREAYANAVRERYRFYSFGDAMLVV